jgi:predicted nucleotidyltransferase
LELPDYRRFTRELHLRLESDPRVLGLVAVGSMAERDYAPDGWSDHDFFVVVAPGAEESFRSDLRWLPRSEEIALSFRETAHGVKVVLRDGHLLEFAVFDPEELSLARVTRYRVLFDRERIAERMEQVVGATRRSPELAVPGDDWLAGQFLTALLVGVGRHLRGERLSGRQLVAGGAVSHLVRLFEKHVVSESTGLLDGLDPLRRFELAYPATGARLNAIQSMETPEAALALLDLAVAELPHLFAAGAVVAVRSRLG